MRRLEADPADTFHCNETALIDVGNASLSGTIFPLLIRGGLSLTGGPLIT